MGLTAKALPVDGKLLAALQNGRAVAHLLDAALPDTDLPTRRCRLKTERKQEQGHSRDRVAVEPPRAFLAAPGPPRFPSASGNLADSLPKARGAVTNNTVEMVHEKAP